MKVFVRNDRAQVFRKIYEGVNVGHIMFRDSGTGTDAKYTHTQDVAATTWTVNHNLGKYPSVVSVDSLNREIDGALTYLNSNSLQIEFGFAFTGKVYCN